MSPFHPPAQIGTITTYYGTDHGICAKIVPQIFDLSHVIPDRQESIVYSIYSDYF